MKEPAFNPFDGAVDDQRHELTIGWTYKKYKKLKTRDGITCDCGAIDKYFTAWAPYHDDDCIINLKKGKKK